MYYKVGKVCFLSFLTIGKGMKCAFLEAECMNIIYLFHELKKKYKYLYVFVFMLYYVTSCFPSYLQKMHLSTYLPTVCVLLSE